MTEREKGFELSVEGRNMALNQDVPGQHRKSTRRQACTNAAKCTERDSSVGQVRDGKP